MPTRANLPNGIYFDGRRYESVPKFNTNKWWNERVVIVNQTLSGIEVSLYETGYSLGKPFGEKVFCPVVGMGKPTKERIKQLLAELEGRQQ
ncbi:MAG: hypothetical protein K2Y22_04310 [Candidatus Obscuribacterales bacterium]|nr:hypothetical protein [Candidatus Obscuribacterales bacterium]